MKTRNALILVPVACFPIVLLLALFFFRSTGLKRSVADPAIYVAQTSPTVAARIGLPIEPGWPVHGTMNANKVAGNADLVIQLTGSRGKGKLTEWAQKENGKWRICSLVFHSEPGRELTLVDVASTHCEPE